MAAFAFETITATQAAAYSGATDALEFQTPGMRAALASASYVAGVDGAPDMVAISFNGQTVMFGTGVSGDEDIRFADGSKLFVGGAGAETTIARPSATRSSAAGGPTICRAGSAATSCRETRAPTP